MKKKNLALIIISLFVCNYAKSQYFPIDTAKLNTSYRELMSFPNTIERQKAFFDAFPNNWTEFTAIYQFMPNDDYDLTMYNNAQEHIEALSTKITLIKDSVYCKKIVNIGVGGKLDADASNYYKALLHKIMWRRMDGMLHSVSKLRKGHQMQFWQYYWSNTVKSKRLETEYNRLLKLNLDTYPKEMKIMEIAFKYFYDGVNIDGGYLKE
ncbi:MAG: hypothetical protein PHQ11_03705 [Paludibacter sp.]|nr:hypothetical protein [Paludibacter sp.]MDD4198389.1 hypothetical protein [Paludibacter sp.]MDD4427067.1 hypothetical protein [Paludibacter sp.]